MANPHDFTTRTPPTWCPGCGDFGIWVALRTALVGAGLDPAQVQIVYGIGCSGNMASFVHAYGFHALHGRSLPVATGIRLANPNLPVICVAGDGDTYGIGVGHLVHAARRNLDIVMLVHDNQVYGLTKGQTSPTSPHGFKSDSTPEGAIELPENPLAVALSAGATFVARGFAANADHLAGLIRQGLDHRGFALIDVLQPCVTFNHLQTYQWFYDRVAYLDGSSHDAHNRADAWKLTQAGASMSGTERIPVGLLYQERRPTYEEQVTELAAGPLAARAATRDISALFESFR
jgi:2-oxoglutarate ferredoxin oxidoreductase subunit beta